MNAETRVLIVEDEVLIAMGMELTLQRAGYTVCGRVETGHEAVNFAKNNKLDLMLLDIQLADDLNGFEAAQQIREFSTVPIIIVSSYDKSCFEEQIINSGAIGFLSKPLRINDLENILRNSE